MHAPVLALLVILELVPDNADHDVVADEPARVHDLLRLDAELRLLRDLLAQHVARRQMAHAELLLDPRRLRALSCIPHKPTAHTNTHTVTKIEN